MLETIDLAQKAYKWVEYIKPPRYIKCCKCNKGDGGTLVKISEKPAQYKHKDC